METVTITLPDGLSGYVHERMTEGGYESADEYLQELIRSDRRRREQERVEALVKEGLDSGDPVETGPAFWADRRHRPDETAGRARGR